MAFVLIFGKYSQRKAVLSLNTENTTSPEGKGCEWLLPEMSLQQKTFSTPERIKKDLFAAEIDINNTLPVSWRWRDEVPSWKGVQRVQPAIYTINSQLEKAVIQSIILAILTHEKSIDQKRRFAIVLYEEGKEQQFFEEIRNSEYIYAGLPSFAQNDKDQFDALESEKQQKKLSSAKWKFIFSPAFWLTLECVFIGICCLVQYLDPTYLLQSSAGAGFLGFAVGACRALTVLALILVPIYSLIMDYRENAKRCPPGTYLSNSCLRLRNWFVDHKLQAGLICLGLFGSLVALILTLTLGIDSPFFEFIGNAIADPGNSLVGNTQLPHEFFVTIGKYVTATIFVLAPSLGFGWFARNAVVIHESRVTPSLDEDASEIRLTEDKMGAEVRFHDHRQWHVIKSTSAEEKNTAQPYTDVFFDGDEIKLCRGNSVESFPRSSFGCFISG